MTTRAGLQSTSLTISSRSHRQTLELGQLIGSLAHEGLVIALSGDIGTGKTTLTQGIAAGLGVEEWVTSPTFTLVNEYTGRTCSRLVHVDTYRLGDLPEQAILESATFGLEEILAASEGITVGCSGTVVVIEWAERVGSLLPVDHLLISLAYDDSEPDARAITISSFGPRSLRLAAAIGPDVSA